MTGRRLSAGGEPFGKRSISLRRFRATPVVLLLLSMAACGSQGFRVLPAGDDLQLRHRCRVVLATTVADRGIAGDNLRVTQLFTPGIPIGAFLRWHVRFHVERVLQGARVDPMLSIDDLAVHRTLPELPPAPVALLPLFLSRDEAAAYEVGYNFELFGHYYGLTIMPTTASRAGSLSRALDRVIHSPLRFMLP